VKSINPNGVAALAKDVEYLTQFVDSLNVPILRENLDELQQTVQLMQADNADEFYDISTRNKKYGRVDAMQGPILLEKYDILHSMTLNLLLTPPCQADSNGASSNQGGEVRESVLAVQEILNLWTHVGNLAHREDPAWWVRHCLAFAFPGLYGL